ncbi:MAG: asparagine synthase-related protein [Flavobacteriales bacterium]
MGGFYGFINLESLNKVIHHDELKAGGLYSSNSENAQIQADGFIYNLNNLKTRYGTPSENEALKSCYEASPNRFPHELRGEFTAIESSLSGIKISTNQMCSRRVFYAQYNGTLFFHYNLKKLLTDLKEKGFTTKPNVLALRSLISIGGIYGNLTPVNEVYVLRAGETLSASRSGVVLKKYYEVNSEPTSLSKHDFLGELHQRFTSAVRDQYTHQGVMGFQLLSGGLDSRMNLSLAAENGIRQQAVLCFGQTGYRDHWISEQIAEAYNLEHDFVPLEPGNYLKAIDENVLAVDGLCFYASSAHFNYALEQTKYISPIIHTGQVGRTIFTDHSFGLWQNLSEYKALLCSSKFADKIDTEVKAEMQTYSDMDVFYLNNRLFRVINSGNWVAQKTGCIVSPFSDPDIFDLAYTALPEWKNDGQLQWDYMWRFHKPIMKFAQEEFGRPIRSDAERLLGRVQNKLRNIYYKKINHHPEKLSMNPLEFWWNTNESLRKSLQEYFKANINRLDHEAELKEDVSKLFHSSVFIEKTLALSVLGVMKNYID